MKVNRKRWNRFIKRRTTSNRSVAGDVELESTEGKPDFIIFVCAIAYDKIHIEIVFDYEVMLENPVHDTNILLI